MAVLQEKKSGLLAYLIVTLICLSACGFLILFGNGLFVIALFLALALGILHIAGLKRFLFPALHIDFLNGIATTIGLMVVSCIILFICYNYFKLSYHFITFEFAFLIPITVWLTYKFYQQIPESEVALWYYPRERKMPDLDKIDFSEIQVVQFVLAKKSDDEKQINFTCKAPLNMSLGQLFYIFINDYNEKHSQQEIQIMNDNHQLYGWFFYKEPNFLKGKEYYDPQLTFRENSITANQSIYVMRRITAQSQHPFDRHSQ